MPFNISEETKIPSLLRHWLKLNDDLPALPTRLGTNWEKLRSMEELEHAIRERASAILKSRISVTAGWLSEDAAEELLLFNAWKNLYHPAP